MPTKEAVGPIGYLAPKISALIFKMYGFPCAGCVNSSKEPLNESIIESILSSRSAVKVHKKSLT
jgi:hypothetical protein